MSGNAYLELLEKLYEKHSEVVDEIKEVKVILARQDLQLAEHIRRTELLEEGLELVRNDIKPLQKHIDYINGGLKLLGLLSLIAGIAVSIVQLL